MTSQPDFIESVKVLTDKNNMDKIVMVQKHMRRVLAMKRILKLSELEMERINKRRELMKINPEGAAMSEFVMQLKAKRITPEAFFRICDQSYQRAVSHDQFEETLGTLRVILRKTDVRRLKVIFDENMTGKITYTEYQQALEAFELAGERHFVGPKPGGKGYVKYEAVVLEKMCDVLVNANVDSNELFTSCDLDNSGSISTEELTQALLNIKKTMQLKEQQAIKKYFEYFDSDGNGTLSKAEFAQQFDRAKMTVEHKKKNDAAAEDDEFAEAELAEGDESMFTDAMDTVKGWFGKKEAPAKGVDMEKIKKIVAQMEKTGLAFKNFLAILKENTGNQPKIPVGQFLSLFKAAYPDLRQPEQHSMFTAAVQEGDVKTVTVAKVNQILTTMATGKKVAPSQLLTFIANMTAQMQMQEDASIKDPFIAVEKRLTKAGQTLIKTPNAVNLKMFTSLITPIVKLIPTDLDLVFKAFSTNNGQFVYLSDIIETTKAHVSISSKFTNKQKFSNLNDIIPGYYLMDPRSKCDAAVSNLIKEMKKNNVKAASVFRMAGSSGGANIYSGQIKNAFIKLAPQINPDLIRDAMLSFGTADNTPVSEAQFCNIFDEQFDKSVSSGVPNSSMSKRQARPASAVVPQSQNESRGLIHKMDNAMLRQKLSPLAAFTAADINKDGVITVTELRDAIKSLLPDDQFTPADLKMTMLAFDTNRNGLIEQEEFIQAFEDARNQGMQGGGLQNVNVDPYEEVQKFERPATGGSSGKAASSGGFSADQNLLKILFTDLKETLKVQNDLSTKNLSLMHLYWDKTGEVSNFVDFEARYCLDKGLMSTPEAKDVYMQLEDNFMEAMQGALDRIYDGCLGVPSKQSKERFELIKNMNVDELGMVSVSEAQSVFQKIHLMDRVLYLKMNQVYQEVFEDELGVMNNSKMFKAHGFLKSFMVKADSVPAAQAVEGKINYMAFATGVWLEDDETLFTQSEFSKYWHDIGYIYLGKLYDIINPDQSAMVTHQQLSHLTKTNFSCNIKKWIRLLDTGPLKEGNQDSEGNQSCLYKDTDSRIRLPPFYSANSKVKDLIKKIENEVSVVRGHKKASPAADSLNSSQLNAQTIIPAIEKAINSPIEKVLFQFIDSTHVPINTLYNPFKKLNKNISKALLEKMVSEACNGSPGPDGVLFGDLVRLVIHTPGKFDKQKDTLVKELAMQIDKPVRQTLQTEIMEYEDGISKDDFINSFSNFDGAIDKWKLVCLFYTFDIVDGQDENVDFETLVKVISDAKGVKYEAPGGDQCMPPKETTVSAKAKPKPATLLNLPGVQSNGRKNQSREAVKQYVLKNIEPLNSARCHEKADEIKKDKDFANCEVNSQKVLDVLAGFALTRRKIYNKATVDSAIKKLSNWIESSAGENDEEAAQLYFLQQLLDVLADPQNDEIDELNVLMVRLALFNMKTHDTNENVFDFFEVMALTMACLSQDEMNQLETDAEFSRALIEMAPYGTKENKEFQKEIMVRLERRMFLADMVTMKAKQAQEKGENFDIMNEKHWEHARFADIAQLTIEKLQDPKLKKLFIDTFKNAYSEQLTYYEFYQLMTVKLNITGIAEWRFEDFETTIDNFGLAFMELNDVVRWLKDHGMDIGVREKTIDLEDEFEKKANITPQEYQLTENDYYRKKKTILNSEVAALAKCLQLEKEVADGEVFFDMEFGPTSEDDDEGSRCSMYCKGVKPQSHPDPANVAWRRPSEYLDPGVQAQFFSGDASANEVKQGALGDCWFIGAMSVMATRDELLRGGAEFLRPEMSRLIDAEIAQLLSMGVFPPIFHRFRFKGIYCLRFFKEFAWRYVIIDDRLPVYKGNNALVFGKCTSDSELWVPMIEKAYAKLFGCYQTLISGFIDDGLADMTGFVCEKRNLHDKNGVFPEADIEKFWEYLKQMKHNKCLMGCSVTGGTEKNVVIDGVNTGIMSGHAYGLNDVIELQDPEKEKRPFHRLVRVRNPWGRGEWTGKWADDSEEAEKHEAKIQEYINELEEDERFEAFANDGTFFINFASWRDVYNRIFVANDFPDDWWAVRFCSEWKASCSGGLPLERTPEANKRFATNPQFLFAPTQDCELFISLAQPDGRQESPEGNYSKYPYKDRIISAMLCVFELPPGASKLEAYTNPMAKSTPKVLHEISLRLDLKAGKKYVIVPSPRNKGSLGKFFLSLYMDCELHDADIRRLDDITDRYSHIMEEYEKNDSRVPKWKVEWVRENLDSMIGKDDKGRKTNIGSPLGKRKSLKKKSMVIEDSDEDVDLS